LTTAAERLGARVLAGDAAMDLELRIPSTILDRAQIKQAAAQRGRRGLGTSPAGRHIGLR
jgi:hypothetical protein